MEAFDVVYVLLTMSNVLAIELNVDDDASVKAAASTIAYDMMTCYKGNLTDGIPGLLPYPPYYWWTAGAMFGSLVDYWYYTGDTTYNDVITKGLIWQAAPSRDFMPQNQTKDEGNDDQAFWAFTAMSMAEVGFPDPPSDEPQWLYLVQAVFNLQAGRWDTSSCGGGLRWQFNFYARGYTYKNTISQGGLFNMAARLGAYTKNETYFDWANKVWNWMEAVSLIGPEYQVFDGSDLTNNCTEQNKSQWTYNFGVFLHGAAVMWNQQAEWRTRIEGLLKQAEAVFFTGPNNNIAIEIACEKDPVGPTYCDNDQVSFKAYLARWMAATTKLAPWSYDTIYPYLRANAMAAAQACVGGDSHRACGNKWWTGGFDGITGVGEQMAALEAIQSMLLHRVGGALAADNGGTSTGNGNAGAGGLETVDEPYYEITNTDRAGAGVLTAVVIGITLGCAWYVA
ncbi:hypothetical protein MRB53_039979 [Persea americana]|nr:hypothetical protein MRB53_039979 [Persea americana]